MILTKDIGIDLGTENTLICDRKGRILIREPSVVAVDVKSRRVLATGNQAYAAQLYIQVVKDLYVYQNARCYNRSERSYGG